MLSMGAKCQPERSGKVPVKKGAGKAEKEAVKPSISLMKEKKKEGRQNPGCGEGGRKSLVNKNVGEQKNGGGRWGPTETTQPFQDIEMGKGHGA